MRRVEVVTEARDPEVSVFIPFTREWALETFLEYFDRLQIPKNMAELVLYVDTEDPAIPQRLMSHFAKTDPFGGPAFNGVKVIASGRPGPGEAWVQKRRERIVEMKEDSKQFISPSAKYVFGLEDDTLVPPEAFRRLYDHIREDPALGYVEGVQVGRWQAQMIGAWRVDNLEDPARIETLKPRKAGTESIDGGGFYCYMTRSDLYRAASYRFEHECFGPDVCYVLDLRRKGFKACIDWSVVTGHLLQGKAPLYPGGPDMSRLIFTKNAEGNWDMRLCYIEKAHGGDRQ